MSVGVRRSDFSQAEPAQTLRVPYFSGKTYDPGTQIYIPGESFLATSGPAYDIKPWPSMCAAVLNLWSYGGVPTAQPVAPTVPPLSAFPNNYLYIAGFTAKSKG